MRHFTNNLNGKRWVSLVWLTAFATLFIAGGIRQLSAQQPSQKTFDSPGKAVTAMFLAAKAGDSNELLAIFGPEAKPILSSGDDVADKNDRDRVAEKYEQMHRLGIGPDKTVTLYIGAENWPFPIPLVSKNDVWFFDTKAGKSEVLFRRIGRNEFSTIDALGVLVNAQKDYESQLHQGVTVRQYAQKILSDPGKQNGLYWKSDAGQPQSPVGPLIASATAAGYEKKQQGVTPFHGYIYRVLESQGKDAPGGAMDYIVNGNMTQGFAFLAYPAEYRNSGVMTFVVGKNGQIYQKDLGSHTEAIASSMKTFNPDKSWDVVE